MVDYVEPVSVKTGTGGQKNNAGFLSKTRCCGVMMDNFMKTSTM